MSEVAGLLPEKKTVNITNDLGPNTDLRVHCKSKDDDLGEKLLHFRGYFTFQFHPNFWGTTLFYCLMKWQNVYHYFDIYIDDRDDKRCTVCLWLIRASGPCMLNRDTQKVNVCFPWDPSSFQFLALREIRTNDRD
ncbi:hypothetical protein JCGZ_16270 [Jatropha curcas]|uniref:S-protein homolog n=1 Tax=Jatropha curcas TaxID=180498 RepID=A0A067L7P2_JATCU|nr:hypothetical protein JCGZ_16270 [Jatropha curcas]